ncbi:MAG: SulP family inorganic anion transporter [Acidimicrobiales bacterium]|nr:SulP family inorganic anion transporter [Acidimicrobiales bacterium]HJM29180.1 SulP family inorganic anion transporter [Acidimicrobiales bacterium]HJM97699.1 SulP family inorganic anion transporter [Acidimicrobiales bacterium]
MRSHLKISRPSSGDIVAGISVALLALPQGLAYAELAGMPAKYGLYAAAIPSLLAAIFASSSYLQTGPVALTALLTYGALQGFAEPFSSEFIELAALLALMVGIFRLLFGVLKLGRIANLLTDSVILGFTTGAAILIIFSQLPKSLGVEGTEGGVLSSGWESICNPDQWKIGALLFSIATIIVIFGGRLLHRLFPGVLIAVVCGIAISHLISYSGPVVGELSGGFISFKFRFAWSSLIDLLVPSIIIAIVGFAEPAAIARTFSKEDKSTWNPNKEFVSQGVANIAAAISNAFPVGGSFGRSSLNKFAGAETPWAGAITGAFVLAVLPLAFLLSELPSAILGATVIGAVVKLVKPREFLKLFLNDLTQLFIAVGTLIATLLTAPRIDRGIIIGLLLSLIGFFGGRVRRRGNTKSKNGPPVAR